MARRRYPAGVQDFESIIKDGFVYVDKTECVYDLANHYGNAMFLSRPRRFGKSLLCSTLKHYFMGHKELFRGLTAVQSYLSALPYDLGVKTELDFEAILKVLFDCVGIRTDVEVRSARGRCDVVMKSRSTVYVLELKISSTATVDDALAQIDEKNYLIPYWNDPRRKVKVGVTVNPDTRTIDQWKVVED